MLASSRGPRAAAGVRGRDKSLPYDQRWARGQPGSRNHPGGRRAGCPHPAGLCAAANTHGRIWNPPLRNGKVRGQPGSRTLCGIANLCRGRCLHRPGDLAPPQGPREGHGPPLQTFRAQPAKPDSRKHPGGRRAGCPHPAGPRGGARSRFLKSPRCGGRERPPYRTGENIETNRENAAAQTPTGGYGIRPYETARPAANRGAAPSAISQGTMLASSRGPRAAARPAGGINPSPTTNGGSAANRRAATTRTAVGRDALIPPDPAAKHPPNFELQRKVRRAAAFSGPPPSSCIPPARRA